MTIDYLKKNIFCNEISIKINGSSFFYSTLPRSNRHLMDIDSNNYASGTLLTKNTSGSFSSFGPPQRRGIWTIEECLTQLKLPQYSAHFKNNGIHLLDDILDRNMDARTLKKIGVGNEKHRKQLLKYFEVVKQQQVQLQQNDYQKSMTIKPSPAVSILWTFSLIIDFLASSFLPMLGFSSKA